MEMLGTVLAGGIILMSLVLTALTLGLVLGGGIVGLLGATRCALRQQRGLFPAGADSRLSVAMWNDIAAILDERR